MTTRIFALAAAAAILAGAGNLATAQAALPQIAAQAAQTGAPADLVLAGTKICFTTSCAVREKIKQECANGSRTAGCTRDHRTKTQDHRSKTRDHRSKPNVVDHRGERTRDHRVRVCDHRPQTQVKADGKTVKVYDHRKTCQ